MKPVLPPLLAEGSRGGSQRRSGEDQDAPTSAAEHRPELLAHGQRSPIAHRLLVLLSNFYPLTTIFAPEQPACPQREKAEVTFSHVPTDSESNI